MRGWWILLICIGAGCGRGSTDLSQSPAYVLPSGTLASPGAQSSFGTAVAVVGGRVAVGAPRDDAGAPDAGRVHLFDAAGGGVVTSLQSPSPAASGHFGQALAAAGDDLLVGAPGEGQAWLLDGETGARKLTLAGVGDFGAAVAATDDLLFVGAPARDTVTAFDARTGAAVRTWSRPGRFGAALAVAGARLLVGAPGAGRAYLLDPADGALVLTLAGGRSFGAAVSAAGAGLLVGEPDARRVLLFDAQGALLRTFVPPGAAERFGLAVAYEDGHVLVAGLAAGRPCIWLFTAATGAHERTLKPDTPHTGMALSAQDGAALVGLYPEAQSALAGLAQTFSCDSGALLQTFLSPTPVAQGHCGASVAIAGTLVAVGAPGEGTGGLCHLYDTDGTFLRTLQSPSAAAGGGFGEAVSADGTLVAVGAPGEGSGEGRVHVFDATDGSLVQTLSTGDPATGEFGGSVVLSGTTVYVGAPGDDVGTTVEEGGVYVFNALSGAPIGNPFRSPKGETLGRFGAAIAVESGELLVGAPGEMQGAGSAHLFDATGGLSFSLTGPVAGTPGSFGAAVALASASIWVGAPDEGVTPPFQTLMTAAGVVRVFDRATGQPGKQLTAGASPVQDTRFGAAIATDGTTVAVGAPGEPTDVGHAQSPPGGTVRTYYPDQAIQVLRLISPQQDQNAGSFGDALAVLGDAIVVGAPEEDRGTAAADAGVAYLYDRGAVDSLFSPAPQDFGGYGYALAALGSDTLLVGAPFESVTVGGGEGLAYIVDITGAQEPLTLANPAGTTGAAFGTTVAAVQGNALVGAPNDAGGGAAYLFDAGGQLLQSYASPGGGGLFGRALGSVGTDVLIGAPEETVGANQFAGRAYLYATDGTLLQTFASPAGEADAYFGSSVAGVGGNVLIGAPGENLGVGRAYLFATDGTLLLTLEGPTLVGVIPVSFGAAVGSQGGDLLVGAPGTSAGGSIFRIDATDGSLLDTIDNPDGFVPEPVGFGSVITAIGTDQFAAGVPAFEKVFLFAADGTLLDTLVSPNGLVGNFGSSVADAGGRPAAGAPFEDVNPSGAGRVYVFNSLGQQAPPPGPDATFVSPSPVTGGRFGWAVCFAALTPIIGAPAENNAEGQAHSFDEDDLTFDQTYPSPNGTSGGAFAEALAGNAVVVAAGAPGETGSGVANSGRAYLFSASSGALMLNFASSNAEAGGRFGAAVAVTATNVVVGAPLEDAGAPDSGRAYYFDCVTSQALNFFESPNPVDNGRFGCAVATVGFDVFVGACNEAGGAGRVYRFNGLSGQLLATYTSPNAEAGGRFGAALAVGGGSLLVGAVGEGVGTAPGAGRAYLIDLATGGVTLTFTSPNPASGGGFGFAVAGGGGALAIGAPDEGGAGHVWVFAATDGALIGGAASPNPEQGGRFGHSLAIVGTNLLVGAPVEDGGATDAGRAYLNPPLQ